MVEAQAVSKSFAGFWDPIPRNGFPCLVLIQGDVASHTAT